MAVATARGASDACIVAWTLSLAHRRTIRRCDLGHHTKVSIEPRSRDGRGATEHVPEDARARRVEAEHFGADVPEPGFGRQGCQLVGVRRRGGCGGTGATGLGTHSDPPAGPQ